MVIKGYDVAIPEEQLSGLFADLADFKALLEKIAGAAVMEILFGAECLPGGDDMLFVTGEDNVVL